MRGGNLPQKGSHEHKDQQRVSVPLHCLVRRASVRRHCMGSVSMEKPHEQRNELIPALLERGHAGEVGEVPVTANASGEGREV